MNNLIEFAKNNRTTTFFRDLAINEIKVAYRVMEYLDPDDIFKPEDLCKKTSVFIENKMFQEAAEQIINESDVCCSSSSYGEALGSQTVELIEYLYPLRQQRILNNKELKRQELLKQLADLDS